MTDIGFDAVERFPLCNNGGGNLFRYVVCLFLLAHGFPSWLNKKTSL